MSKIFTYKYFISCLLHLCFITVAWSQNTAPIYPDVYGLRIGVDALSASRNIWDKDFKGLDIQADYRLNKKWYAVAEAGFVDKWKEEDRMTFSTKGSYLRIGADKNLYQNWLDMNNMIYVGGRYGFSLFEQQLHSYEILTQGDYINQVRVNPNETFTGLSAHWIELVTGLKAEVAKNVFIGMSFRLHALIYQKQPESFENLYIPGYGKKYSGNIGASFNYSISYLFPMKKKYEAPTF